MEKEQTTTIGARIPLSLLSEIHKELKDTKQSMSDFVEDSIKERLFSNSSEDLLNKEIAYHQAIIDNIKTKKEQFKEKSEILQNIPEVEISFLVETDKMLEENPNFCDGRINLYKNKFGKHYRISPNEFFELCSKAVEQQTIKEIEIK